MKRATLLALAGLLSLTAANLKAEERLGQIHYNLLEKAFSTKIEPFVPFFQDKKVRELTTKFELKASPKRDSVNIIVTIQKDQIESITKQGGHVEVRLYAGPSGQERRLENRTYELRQAKQSFTLPYKDICSKKGEVSVKVWTTVKDAKRSYGDHEARSKFVCLGGKPKSSKGQTLDADVDFEVSAGQVYAVVDVDQRQFNRVDSQGGYVEVRLYAGDRRGGEGRLKGRTYAMPNSKLSYTFPPSEVCNDSFSFGSYNRYLKVWVSARNRKGKDRRDLPLKDSEPLKGFVSSEGASLKVTCSGSLWDAWELLEDLLDD